MALSILGSNRHKLSPLEYKRQQGILKMQNLVLPEWGVMRQIRGHLESQFGLKVVQRLSSLGNPCFWLQVQDIIAQVSGIYYIWHNCHVLVVKLV